MFKGALQLACRAQRLRPSRYPPLPAVQMMPAPEDLHAVTIRIMDAADVAERGGAADWDVMVGMLESGFEFSTTEGVTALHLAVMCGNAEAARRVAAAGTVDVDATMLDLGLTALHMAVVRETKNRTGAETAELIRVLLAAGADASIRDADRGMTPLELATSFGRPAAARALREGGAQVAAGVAQRKPPAAPAKATAQQVGAGVMLKTAAGKSRVGGGLQRAAWDGRSCAAWLARLSVCVLVLHATDAAAHCS